MLTLYTKKDCNPCAEAKKLLTLDGMEFSEIDIGTPEAASFLMSRLNTVIAPVLHSSDDDTLRGILKTPEGYKFVIIKAKNEIKTEGEGEGNDRPVAMIDDSVAASSANGKFEFPPQLSMEFRAIQLELDRKRTEVMMLESKLSAVYWRAAATLSLGDVTQTHDLMINESGVPFFNVKSL